MSTCLPLIPRSRAAVCTGLCLALPLCSLAFFSLSQSAAAAAPLLTDAEQERCVQLLKSALTGDDFWPAMHAAEALTSAGHGDVVLTQLTPRLSTTTDLRHRCGLARELVRAGDRAQVRELLAVLANPDPAGHIHACESLYKVGEIGDGQLLRAAFADTTIPVKSLMAAAALARQGDSAAFQKIRSHLMPLDVQHGWLAAWILGVLGTPADIPALQAAAAGLKTERDRAYCEHALAQLGSAEGAAALVRNLQSADVVIRADAAYLAGDAKLTSVAPALKRLLEDPQLDVRVRAAQGLLKLAQVSEPLAKPQGWLTAAPMEPQVVLQLPPGPQNSRNSEGDFAILKDGRVLFIYSHFLNGRGGDHDSAELRARVSKDGGQTWSDEDTIVARPTKGLNLMSVSLLRLQSGELALFYCSKVSLTDCRPEMRVSRDEGQTWSEPVACITDQIGYYVMNNNRAIQLSSGRLVLPVCLHWPEGQAKPDWAGETMCYLSDDNGKTWRRSQSTQKAFDEQGKRMFAQEPGVIELKDHRLLMYSRSDVGVQLLSESHDGGETWSPHRRSSISSPRSPASVRRIPQTGDLLMVWNNSAGLEPKLAKNRTPLTIAISRDDGVTWERTRNLYTDPNGWYCYTAINFVGDVVLLGHCAGNRQKNNGLAQSDVTRFNLAWLYGSTPK